MTEEPEIVDEARHAKLVERHVYGDPGRRPQGRAEWFRYSSAASVGIEIAVAIVGCTLFASWLEREYTHWSPWTMLIGFGIGVGAAIKALVRTAKQYQREIAEREQARPREQARHE
jgi:F0F1-type ATP synthase assembly protein I